MENKKNFINRKNILISFLILSVFLNLLLAKFLYKRNSEIKSLDRQITSLKTKIKTGNKPDNLNQYSDFFPKDISTKINQPIGKRSNEINVSFDGSDKTTYDETKYSFKGQEFIYLKLNLADKDFRGNVQKLKQESDNYLDFIYEGAFVRSISNLLKELEQNLGVYPRSIYNEPYEIFKNKNNIKIKRQYSLVPGYILYSVEFISNIPYDSNFKHRYYSFETDASIVGDKSFGESEFYKNPINWIKRNPQKNFKDLDAFIDTIGK
ncbi:MAG: hypothetical protein Q7K55_07750 [Candidatus Levybacteria bacterium]|nr:hypothetical protein [Candidatus Levybacteria bacterium]